MSTYYAMKQDFDKKLHSLIKSNNLKFAYDEDCDACNGTKDFYSNNNGDVIAYSCFECNEVRTL